MKKIVIIIVFLVQHSCLVSSSWFGGFTQGVNRTFRGAPHPYTTVTSENVANVKYIKSKLEPKKDDSLFGDDKLDNARIDNETHDQTGQRLALENRVAAYKSAKPHLVQAKQNLGDRENELTKNPKLKRTPSMIDLSTNLNDTIKVYRNDLQKHATSGATQSIKNQAQQALDELNQDFPSGIDASAAQRKPIRVARPVAGANARQLGGGSNRSSTLSTDSDFSANPDDFEDVSPSDDDASSISSEESSNSEQSSNSKRRQSNISTNSSSALSKIHKSFARQNKFFVKKDNGLEESKNRIQFLPKNSNRKISLEYRLEGFSGNIDKKYSNDQEIPASDSISLLRDMHKHIDIKDMKNNQQAAQKYVDICKKIGEKTKRPKGFSVKDQDLSELEAQDVDDMINYYYTKEVEYAADGSLNNKYLKDLYNKIVKVKNEQHYIGVPDSTLFSARDKNENAGEIIKKISDFQEKNVTLQKAKRISISIIKAFPKVLIKALIVSSLLAVILGAVLNNAL